MTLDEAINHAEEVADFLEDAVSKYDMTDAFESYMAGNDGEEAKEHRQLAEWLRELKRLKEQGSCDDCISRQTVLDKIKEICFSREQEWVNFRVSQGSHGQRDLIINFIEDLPSVQPKPQPKTGHWIDKFGGEYRCSCCREIISIDTEIEFPNGITYKYCPNCGCRMEGSDG